jgi:hypothetical protein
MSAEQTRDALSKRMLRTQIQNDLTAVNWDNLKDDTAGVTFDLNASFRYGIATETEVGLPELKKVIVPYPGAMPSANGLAAMYANNELMVGRFAATSGNEVIHADDALETAAYRQAWKAANKAKFETTTDGTTIDVGQNVVLKAPAPINPNQLGWLLKVCVRLNYLQFKATYPQMPDHVAIAGAHAVGMAWRNGLLESYAGREFIFCFVDPTENQSCRILGIDSEFEKRPVKGFNVGDVLPAASLKLNSQFMEVGLGIVVGSGATHYTMNHTTGGREMTGQNVKALIVNSLYYPKPAVEAANRSVQTSYFYNFLHPVNKRAVACLCISNAKVHSWYRNAHLPGPAVMHADAFMQYRTKLTPAGCHKIYIAILALKHIADAGLTVFLPDLEFATRITNLYSDVNRAGARGHIGSMYYTDAPQSVFQGDVDDFIPIAAYFVTTRMPGSTIAQSPHMSLANAEVAPNGWKQIVNKTKKVGLGELPDEVVQRYLGAAGAVGFTLNINTQEGIQDAIVLNTTIQSRVASVLLGEEERVEAPARPNQRPPDPARRSDVTTAPADEPVVARYGSEVPAGADPED